MSKIQWTERTWNPVRGCSRVSPGCDNCYAMGQAHRFSGAGKRYEGLTTIRRGKVDWTGTARFVPEMLDVPLRTRKPTTWFVNSMSDLFHHSVTNDQIAAVFGVMAACPHHTFQVLTKRAERMREWFELIEGDPFGTVYYAAAESLKDDYALPVMELLCSEWPLPNVHLGVSCEDQERADERIPHLLATPAAVRFVSAEPLLGPINLTRIRNAGEIFSPFNALARWTHGHRLDGTEAGPQNTGLDWVIVGGESGHGARPCDVAWIRSIVEECREAGVACFVKQLGAAPIRKTGKYVTDARRFFDRKGGDPSEWPEDLRVREFPEARP